MDRPAARGPSAYRSRLPRRLRICSPTIQPPRARYSLTISPQRQATAVWPKWITTLTSTGSPYQPYWATLGIGSTNEYAGAWTWTPNSRWVNDLRGGAAPNSGNSVASDTGVIPANAYTGVGSGYGINTGASGYGFTCTEITGVFPTNMGLGNCGKNGIRGPQYQLDFTDKVSYLRGNHTFKFGYEQVFVRFDDSSTASQNGIVSFTSL